MTISKDRVKPSPMPDSWKLREIFATGVVLGSYLALMTVIFFWAMSRTDFFSDTFHVRPLRNSLVEMMAALYLQVPVQYGGLNKEGDHEFGPTDPATEITIKPATKQTVEFPVSETCLLVWEIRVVGWDVSYTAEFVPSVEDGYTVIVQKARKIAPTEEPAICNSFKIGEPGKVVLTIDNPTSKKKKFLYCFKTNEFFL